MKEFFNDYVQTLETYIMFRIKEETARLTPELVAKNRKPISLSMGAPAANPPQFVIDKLTEAMNIKGIHSYSSPKGELYLREAIQKRMKSRFNVDLDVNKEIFSLIGSKEGIANFIRALINPTSDKNKQDIIMIPDPGYASYQEMIKSSGGRAYPIPLTVENEFMPEMEEVWTQMVKDGFNPEYAKSIVEFCKKHNIVLISDAAYSDLYFTEDEKPFSILEIEGAKDLAVEFYSFSKPYAMTGWRIGWVCGNAVAVDVFGKLKSAIDTGIYKAIQYAASEVLNSKEGDDYILASNIGFKKKQDIFVKGLKELGWGNFQVPTATFYLWLPIPPRYKTSVEFTNDLLRTSGIVAVPGSAFGQYGEGYFRASIVCNDEDLQECIDRMKADGFYFNK